VRLTPRARADRIEGLAADAEGNPVLKAAVTAPPEKGKANAALVALLAKAWRLPKSALAIQAGASGRRKSVTIAGDPQELLKRLTDWAHGLGKEDQ
jgi:uncharacterized protein YggU (UPF0235/DUF167 family)